MASETFFDARINFGQGKTATTLRTEDGCYYPVIHEPYSHHAYYGQSRSNSAPPRRGDRPMHKTTLTIAKPPWSPNYHYVTTTKQYFSGNKTLEPVQRLQPCPSMHRSQINFGTKEDPDHFYSENMVTYGPKNCNSASQLHLMSINNKLNQTEGSKVREVIKPSDGQYSYWSQYNRVHNKLGLLRGPGMAREYPVRTQYNIITGEECGPAWKPDNHIISGNRMLHEIRSQLVHNPLIY
ncbi:hypothetical protein BgiMline_004702 [Biomphalaria glabrata]|uniref:Uncharacterized protein LOC106066018 n=1 Tax=Biomphalaria glabrata TaxID=6526 RepID=A0A9W2ZPN7_BIOGL|nr:uncharacterized protein LOC106066018 [Biomphalaria glabrata]XP_055876941.1 uncharacterized protein LOC106066018 [Biomphalaria glabrata]XP_055876942.1 uncharacterized protein LOC106066018 [Biomphalaria glabrata]XP_055876943.1 uncharacterized protein LOC106066018 [Biomphalaria glabrata]KAI8765133.1 CAunnamed protein product [Biomphalaria glabrata]